MQDSEKDILKVKEMEEKVLKQLESFKGLPLEEYCLKVGKLAEETILELENYQKNR